MSSNAKRKSTAAGSSSEPKRGRSAQAAPVSLGVLAHGVTAARAKMLGRGAHRSSTSSQSFAVRSGWLPHPTSSSRKQFLQTILNAPPPSKYAPSVQAMADLLERQDVLGFLLDSACKESNNVYASRLVEADEVHYAALRDRKHFLDTLNGLLTAQPVFVDFELVGLPFSAFMVALDPTMSGSTLFRLPQFNVVMSMILNEWHQFLDAPGITCDLFGTEGKQWLSKEAKKSYQFEMWAKDSEQLPYWRSWNSFFTRQFKDPAAMRPVAAPASNAVAISANDGSLFKWADGVGALEVFWFKDMQYSLGDILSSPNFEDQAVLSQHNLIEKFTDGSIFQTYLNPYNFHRWWIPVNGKVLFKPIVVPGCFFNKLVLPDFFGATTASLPYLAQVNARGLIVFDTPDVGLVCCVPLGMSEVSTITFDDAVTVAGAQVTKGQEMGRFQYGGSSFALIFQKLPGKRLVFQTAEGVVYDKEPVAPTSSADSNGSVTLIGSQIGLWHDVSFSAASTLPWQNSGYVNDGKVYSIQSSGGVWTADPDSNDGNLYGAAGVPTGAVAPADFPLPGAPIGALVARVGTNAPFLVGSASATTKLGQTGQLQFCINGKILTTNNGSVLVDIVEFSV